MLADFFAPIKHIKNITLLVGILVPDDGNKRQQQDRLLATQRRQVKGITRSATCCYTMLLATQRRQVKDIAQQMVRQLKRHRNNFKAKWAQQ
jgi:hypothetical protein